MCVCVHAFVYAYVWGGAYKYTHVYHTCNIAHILVYSYMYISLKNIHNNSVSFLFVEMFVADC